MHLLVYRLSNEGRVLIDSFATHLDEPLLGGSEQVVLFILGVGRTCSYFRRCFWRRAIHSYTFIVMVDTYTCFEVNVDSILSLLALLTVLSMILNVWGDVYDAGKQKNEI